MNKIVFFVPSLQHGGVEKTFITVANKLVTVGYTIDFVVCNYSGELKDLLSDKITVVDLGNIRVRNSLFPLIRYIKSNAPNILIAGPDFSNFMAILAKLIIRHPKTKFVITQHNYFNIESENLGLYGKLQPFFIKLLYPKADKIIAVSDGIVDYLVKHGINKSKVKRIYNPIDNASICQLAEQEPPLNYKNNFLDDFILYVGRLNAVKNIPLLIQAFAILSQKQQSLKLVIVGDGEERAKLENLCSELNIKKRVFFLGALANPYYFFNQCKLIALPSLSESLSVVVIEALSSGKTVVSTPCAGPLEVLKGTEYGYVSNDFSSEKEYANLIEIGLLHPFPKEKLQKRAMDFDICKIIPEYQSVLNELL